MILDDQSVNNQSMLIPLDDSSSSTHSFLQVHLSNNVQLADTPKKPGS